MRDEQKTKKELIAELQALRQAGFDAAVLGANHEATYHDQPCALQAPDPLAQVDSPQVYKNIVEQIPLGIGVWKLEQPGDSGSLRYIYRNPAADLATSAPLRKFIGTTIRDNFPLLMETELPSTLLDVIQTGRPAELGEFTYGDETIDEAIYSVKVFHLGEQFVGMSFENITEVKLAREAREDALIVLELANEE